LWLVAAAWSACAQSSNLPPVPPPVQNPHGQLPGLRPDGSVLLPNQWSLRPAGRQVPLGDFPVNIAVHPSGKFAAVLHSGFAPHQIIVVDLRTAGVVASAPVNESFYGLQFSTRGDRLYCSGAGDEVIHEFEFNEGKLQAKPNIRLRPERERGIPCGLAVAPDNRTLYAANVWGQRVSIVDLPGRTNGGDIFVGEGTNAPSPAFERRKTLNPDFEAITKRAEAPLDPSAPDAPFPYGCVLDVKRHRLFVSLWARSCVAVIDLPSRRVVDSWPSGEHPNEMVLARAGRVLFVANANHNTVTVLDTASGKTLETLDAALTPGSLPGSTPNSLALSPDGKQLFVANACNNNVAVFDVSKPGQSHSLGFIPVGWYPTSVRVTPDGRQLLVANGKGLISKANPKGPQPGQKANKDTQSIKDLFPGTLSIIDLPRGKDFSAQLASWTTQAYQCAPRGIAPAALNPKTGGTSTNTPTLQDSGTPPLQDSSTPNPVPSSPGLASPIKYCIYIVKENRTYDQILGDMTEGNGDASLCLFPERVTPNQHKIARDYVLLDNFYVDAEVSADGHEWSMGAYATDFVEKTWPMNYGHNHSKKYPYPAEGNFPIATPASGYLWDRAREAGVSYRSYGEFVTAGKTDKDPAHARLPALQDHFDPWYHGFDTGYPDVKRAERFIAELKRFETEGDMPRLQIVRLPNDHTAGALPGRLTPTAYQADNDLALGMLVEAVSHSKFWTQTAIFVLEDDAQNGPDHVDAHRSPAYLISPYVRRQTVDSTMYSTSSMLRTMELILGLQPMTQFDLAATPMFNAFQSTPDPTPYTALPANVDLKQRNSLAAWGNEEARKMDFSREDAADETALNEMIWRSVRGADRPMPAPVHAAFVFAHAKDKDDD
jgi:DNA-binding beta-propeller fold protein YncE